MPPCNLFFTLHHPAFLLNKNTSSDSCLGARLSAAALRGVLGSLLTKNLSRQERPTPICIWGTHGLGKTEIAMELARERGWKFAYCAPAQFEEMGDLHGLPERVNGALEKDGSGRTAYSPPEWVPTEAGPGILLLDDINRADDRILRGIMQLLQHYEMFSWALPPKWQIIATANPDSGDYSVTAMDDAMLTRMLHLTLVFEAKPWAAWALTAGIDTRGIDFVLTYPEIVVGRRTTPRSLVQFFTQIKDIPALADSLDLVSVLAGGCLEEATAGSFVRFVQDSLSRLPSPEEILLAESPKDFLPRVRDLAAGTGGVRRMDLLSTLSARIEMELRRASFQPSANSAENLIEFLLCDVIPGDLRFALHRDLCSVSILPVPGARTANVACKDRRVATAVLKMI